MIKYISYLLWFRFPAFPTWVKLLLKFLFKSVYERNNFFFFFSFINIYRNKEEREEWRIWIISKIPIIASADRSSDATEKNLESTFFFQ